MDDHSKGTTFPQSKNVRFSNNLVLKTTMPADMVLLDYSRTTGQVRSPGDMNALLTSPEWRFDHNCRELAPLKPDLPDFGFWIPAGSQDRLQVPIPAGSRKFGDPDFLCPPKDSPLATAGVNDRVLPAYLGAIPPEGMEPWDWEKTWKALAR